MAGPTPVSALIHAATMVTAGVYLIARTHELFLLSPVALNTVAVVGATTLLMAAFTAMTQHDIKRILAYSTISQIGYMFLALGVGAWASGVFHLMTHAFFKALLFLGAGAVVYSLHHEHDIFKMGGLRKKLPVAFWSFLIGSAALAALPFTSGFYSKDAILLAAYDSAWYGPALWGVGLIGALLTSIYSFRLVFIVFFGEIRTEPSEPAGWIMAGPLVVLCTLSVLGGLVQLPFAASTRRLEHWLEPTLFGNEVHLSLQGGTLWVLAVVAVAGGAVGILVAVLAYLKRRVDYRVFERPILAEAWRLDRRVADFMGGPGRVGFEATANFDSSVVDGAVNGVATMVRSEAGLLRRFHNGLVRTYAAGIGVGAVGLVVWFLSRTSF